MANVQFFHSVLIGLIAMTLVSVAMTGVSQKLMPVRPTRRHVSA